MRPTSTSSRASPRTTCADPFAPPRRIHHVPETPDLRTLADEDLMQLMRRGDPRAFEAVYERHAGFERVRSDIATLLPELFAAVIDRLAPSRAAAE